MSRLRNYEDNEMTPNPAKRFAINYLNIIIDLMDEDKTMILRIIIIAKINNTQLKKGVNGENHNKVKSKMESNKFYLL